MSPRENNAAIIADAFAQRCVVRRWLDTAHGFRLALGWSESFYRAGRACGPCRVILTHELLCYLQKFRHDPRKINLPISPSKVRSLRRRLGHDWHHDRRAWWEERFEYLSALTPEEFADRYGCSAGAARSWRRRLIGARRPRRSHPRPVRPAGWWRSPDIIDLLKSSAPDDAIADQLDLPPSIVRRLRASAKRF